MKAYSALLPAALLASACASASRPPSMPDWSPDESAPAAALRVDDDPIHPPSDTDDTIRVPSDAGQDQVRVLSDPHDSIRVPGPVEKRQKHWQASGLYIGGAIITSQPMGDFDGKTALFGPTDVILVPDIDAGAGAGLYVSYRWHMDELVLQYSMTEHDGSFPGSPREHDTTFTDIDLNWRHYFWDHSALQPYALLGLGWGRAEIDNGSTDQATGTQFQDAKLEDGINVNLGIGAALYTLPWVVFFGQGMYRFVRYEASDGIDGKFSNTPDIDGDGWNVSFGAAIRVLPPRD